MHIAGNHITISINKNNLIRNIKRIFFQDFEALTPNLLARTIETVEGGGLVVLLLRSLTSLKQLYTMSMDIHERYRTEAHTDIVGRFNERYVLLKSLVLSVLKIFLQCINYYNPQVPSITVIL